MRATRNEHVTTTEDDYLHTTAVDNANTLVIDKVNTAEEGNITEHKMNTPVNDIENTGKEEKDNITEEKEKVCNNCGYLNKINANFCTRCGRRLN